MKNLIIYSFLFFGLINGQTRNEIEKAKNYIKREGLSESQVRTQRNHRATAINKSMKPQKKLNKKTKSQKALHQMILQLLKQMRNQLIIHLKSNLQKS